MLLIITGKSDGTVDALVDHLRAPFFRFNLDDFRKYKFSFSNEYWRIENPIGLVIDSNIATNCFWWKAFMYQIDPDSYVKEEIKIIGETLYSWFITRNLTKGNPPYLESYFGKFRQADLASKYLSVPTQKVGWGQDFLREFTSDQTWVAKSLSGHLTESGKALFTAQVDCAELDFSFPWYLQKKVDSDLDITVLVAGGELFAFKKSRADLDGIDWRKDQFKSKSPWLPYELADSDRQGIMKLLNEMNVRWGRLDFLESENGLEFLELNPNGQWVFLDPNNEYGLLSAVAEYLLSPNPKI